MVEKEHRIRLLQMKNNARHTTITRPKSQICRKFEKKIPNNSKTSSSFISRVNGYNFIFDKSFALKTICRR